MKTTIGGDRLGSGNKQKISLKHYNRSTHKLDYIWRSSMAAGTLVPFMSEIALPGDSFDIDLNCEVLTLPTVGPLFGSYKVQLDIFQCPIRLYNANLHMNKLGIGLNMRNIKLPKVELTAYYDHAKGVTDDNEQINPSSIMSYLNIRGLGKQTDNAEDTVTREFNALSYLSYWDIYKNYYANKQEERGFVIHNNMNIDRDIEIDKVYLLIDNVLTADIYGRNYTIDFGAVANPEFTFLVAKGSQLADIESVRINITGNGWEFIAQYFDIIEWLSEPTSNRGGSLNFRGYNGGLNGLGVIDIDVPSAEKLYGNNTQPTKPKLKEFPLKNIDDCREEILKDIGNSSPFVIDRDFMEPYTLPLHVNEGVEIDDDKRRSILSSQEGLAVKTYQSDLFNNWISTEWIDGSNGINEVTAVSTEGDSFTIDALNLANKVYNMLNRIAISGGSYDDWLDAVYTHERAGSIESPMYHGSLIKELSFQEVVSTAGTGGDEEQPLGTLAGRGRLTNKHKGGKIKIKTHEPSYIIGIVSITPRIDYSQGNKWDTQLRTMDDLHKPALDQIGFQDLITDQMAWFDTDIGIPFSPDHITYKSAGKQPAWINYMTNVNQTRGNFAIQTKDMFMTLNRRYEIGEDGIDDLTTYVDPSKFNHIFAETELDAQNFWVQISNDITARRKMSAKIIPNL